MTHSDVTLDMFFIKALMLPALRCAALGDLQGFWDEIWWFLFLFFIRNSMNLAVSQYRVLREAAFHDKSTYLVASALCLGTVVGGLARLLGKSSMSLVCPSYKKTVSSSLRLPRWNWEVISVWDLGIKIQLNLYFPRSKEKKDLHPHFLIWLVLFQVWDSYLLGKVSKAKLGHMKLHFNLLHRLFDSSVHIYLASQLPVLN